MEIGRQKCFGLKAGSILCPLGSALVTTKIPGDTPPSDHPEDFIMENGTFMVSFVSFWPKTKA
jgi:hypothetical protein